MKNIGILLPIFSLPNKYGIGDFGPSAYQFIDILKNNKLKCWEVLPINPIDSCNSPYSPISSMAIEPLFISLELLMKDGLLDSDYELESSTRIDYDKVKEMKPSAIREIFKSLSDPNVISFAAGNPSPLSFPVEKMHSIANDIFENEAAVAFQYGITEGYPALREQVRARLKQRFNTGADEDEVIITTGGQQGIDLAAKSLLNEGDGVICEQPSFIGGLNCYRSYNAELYGVNVEDDGINIEELEEILRLEYKRNKAVEDYISENFNNPDFHIEQSELVGEMFQLLEGNTLSKKVGDE